MIKLIVTDIDGTLLPDGEDLIHPGYFDLIKKLSRHGIIFGAASGRQYASLRKLFYPVQDDLVYITENGAHVIYKGKELLYAPMSKKVSEALVLDTRAIPGAQSMYCTRDVAYFEPKDKDVYKLMSESYHFKCRMIPDLLKLEEPCLKYSLYLEEHVEEITAKNFIPKWKQTHDVACGGKYFMDVMEDGVNKGTALSLIQDCLHISWKETMAFGDNSNDLEMLDKAFYSFAVGNARQEVRNAASYMTGTNNQHGVLEILRSLVHSIDQKISFSVNNKILV